MIQRLFVDAPLDPALEIVLGSDQGHYVRDVLRLRPGDHVLVFNGRDGEWVGVLSLATKKEVRLNLAERTRAQTDGIDLHCLFAPLKRVRLDFMAQKATEMGVSRLRPVMTRHTLAERVNLERLRVNAVEAAEQCGLLGVPTVDPPEKLAKVLDG